MGKGYWEFNKMRIAWFTPFEKKSAIGRYSVSATYALAKYAEVVVFSELHDKMHNTDLNVVYYEDEENLTDILATFDCIVYNMGDYCTYHKSIYNVLKKHPGVVILHDICMHGFFCGYFENEKKLLEIFQELYGDDYEKILKTINSSMIYETINMLDYNMLELVCMYARGVLVHSRYHEKYLKEVYNGAYAVIPLVNMNNYTKKDTEKFNGYDRNKINILTVGNVNPNKWILKMMDAISSSDFLRKNICYTVIGSTPNERYLFRILKKIEKEKLDDSFKILGYVENDELQKYYNHADILCNLRYPALEGGSASLQEELLQGKVTIVVDTGVYGEVPNDCVIKVSIDNTKNDIVKALTHFINNRESTKIIGENAAKYAKIEYDEENYAKLFVKLIDEVVFLNPIYKVMNKVNHELNSMGMDRQEGEPSFSIVNGIAKELEDMFYKKACEENI